MLAVLLGAVLGVVGSLWQGYGTAATLLTLVVLAVGALTSGLAAGSRLGAACVSVTSFVAALFASVQRPEGDLLITNARHGYVWLAGGLVVVLAGIVPDYARLGARPLRRARAEPNTSG